MTMAKGLWQKEDQKLRQKDIVSERKKKGEKLQKHTKTSWRMAIMENENK